MDVRNCRGCGKLFNYIHGPHLCPTCAKALDVKFEDVKQYVYDHPRVDMQEVSEVFEISISQIKQWIREERLSFAEDSMIGLDCERCGVTIKTGRFCKACKDNLARGFNDLYHKPEAKPKHKPVDTKESAKMRFLDQDRNS
jgi:predicted amidophosphoribosyltransferase